MKKAFALLSLLLFVAGIGKTWHWAKDGFSIQRVRFSLASFRGERTRFEPSFRPALDQPYFYLSRGHQCYAFASADGKYVLKLPRHDRYEIPFWLRACHFPFLSAYREGVRADKRKRFHFMLDSFDIAQRELREETALIYLHLFETDCIQMVLTVRDRLGRTYPLDLDRTAFILQEKKSLMMPLFEQSLASGDRDRAKKILDSFLQIIAARARKGIFNKDPSFLRNFALDEESAIQIDIGSFYRDPKRGGATSFRQTVSHVHLWLQEQDPEMLSWFEKRTEEIVQRELQ